MTLPREMLAARIAVFSEPGEFGNVQVQTQPLPEPAPGEVLVRMRRAPVNPSDFNRIHGTYHHALARAVWNVGKGLGDLTYDPAGERPCPPPPYGLGGEGMGEVVASGGGFLANRLVGKRVAVAGGALHGTWQQYTVAEARRVVPLRSGIDDEQGAMLLVNPLTAYAMVLDVLDVQAGDWLLITAAGSSLAAMLRKLAKSRNAKLLGVVRRQAGIEPLLAAGFDAVVATDRDDLLEHAHKVTGGRGVSYALDCVGGELADTAARCLRPGGRMLLYGTLGGEPVVLPPRDLMMPGATIHGFFLPHWLGGKGILGLLRVLRRVQRLVQDGTLASQVEQRFGLDEISVALSAAAAPGRTGKILLDLERADVTSDTDG